MVGSGDRIDDRIAGENGSKSTKLEFLVDNLVGIGDRVEEGIDGENSSTASEAPPEAIMTPQDSSGYQKRPDDVPVARVSPDGGSAHDLPGAPVDWCPEKDIASPSVVTSTHPTSKRPSANRKPTERHVEKDTVPTFLLSNAEGDGGLNRFEDPPDACRRIGGIHAVHFDAIPEVSLTD